MSTSDWVLVAFFTILFLFGAAMMYASMTPDSCERHQWEFDKRIGKLRCAVCNKLEGL